MATKEQVDFYDNFINHFEEQQNNGRNTDFRNWTKKWIHEPKKILDVGCFPAGTEIETPSGGCPVEDIAVGDKVITHLGRSRKVVDTFRFEGKDLLEVKSCYGYSVQCTPEHPFYVVRRGGVKCYYGVDQQCNTSGEDFSCTNCGSANKFVPEWVEAGDLRLGDFLCVRKETLVEEGASSKDLAILLGFYVAEGYLLYSHKPKLAGICLTFHKDEKTLHDKVIKCARTLKPTSITQTERDDRNTMDIFIYGKHVAEKMRKLGGSLAHQKQLDPSVFRWSRGNKLELLKAWLQGDGHHRYDSNHGESLSGSTVSPRLFSGMQRLLRSFGILPGVSVRDENQYPNEYAENRRKAYSIMIAGGDLGKLKVRRKKQYVSKRRYRQDENYFYIPVVSIQEVEGKHTVYNFEVAQDNSYVANGLCVHNCALGYNSAFFTEIDCEVHGIDISPKCIMKAKNKYPKCTWHCGDITEGFDPGVRDFDFILLSDVLEHIPEEKHAKLFRTLGTWTTEKGVLVASVPNPVLHEEIQQQTYQPVEEKVEIPELLQRMREGGFNTIVTLFLLQGVYYRMIVQKSGA